MNNRTLMYMTVFVIVGMVILLLLNTLLIFKQPVIAKYLSRNEVRGMAVVHNKKEYTLNFDQQNAVIAYINQAEPVPPDLSQTKQTPLDFEKIIVYKFKSPNIEIMPIGYYNNDLLFSVPQWNPKGLLSDTSHGEFKSLLSTTYDP